MKYRHIVTSESQASADLHHAPWVPGDRRITPGLLHVLHLVTADPTTEFRMGDAVDPRPTAALIC